MTSLLLAVLLALPACAAVEMESATYLIRPGSDQAGGANGTLSDGSYRVGGSVRSGGGRMTSTSYRASWGLRTILHYPKPILDLAEQEDADGTVVTHSWTSPGFDGSEGRLLPGTSYFIVVASFTTPNPFIFKNARSLDGGVLVSTSGVLPGVLDSSSTRGLVPNTTFYAHIWTADSDGNLSFISRRSTFTTLARKASFDPNPYIGVFDTSVTVNWGAFPLSPPDASSRTAEGFLIEASSTNFGALTPGGVVYSSMTRDVRVSTLTLGDPAPLDYCTTYYFRLATLNWVDAPNRVALPPQPTYDDDAAETSTQLIDLGSMDMAAEAVIPMGVLVTNTGRCPATYHLSATTVTAGSPWQIFAAPGLDRFSLSAGFNPTEPAPGDFGAEDFLSDSAVPATSSVFSIVQTGYRVPRGGVRTLWLKVRTPTITSTLDNQDIRVNITAVRDPP